MASEAEPGTTGQKRRWAWLAIPAVLLAIGAVVVLRYYAGRESTDDAQIDGRIVPIASKVGGPVVRVLVADNQHVDAGAVLVQIDQQDYQASVDHAAAELADAQANAQAEQTGVPIAETTTSSDVTTARSGVQQADSAIVTAEHEVDAASARYVWAQARQRETEANWTKAQRDVDRLKSLADKDEIPRQQFDAAVAAADAAHAAVDAAKADVTSAQTNVQAAQSRVDQAKGASAQARASLQSAQTAPQQLAVLRAKAAGAAARVQRAQAALAQAQLNLQRTTIKAPNAGTVSRKAVEVGQLVQPNQPLMAIVSTDEVWVTANFKETQLESMRAGQPATIAVDAAGGRTYRGHVDSIAHATGARFSLLPPENASGNYVKVVQRVPVKIVLEPGQDPERFLRPGLSVVPTVLTR